MSKNPPAFPNKSFKDWKGMDLRDWFAGQALAGIAASEGHGAPKYAYWLADQMLSEREKNHG